MTVVNGGREARKFKMLRIGDETGVSGTGHVLDGVIWHNGLVSICWRTSVEGSIHGWTSINLYPNYLVFYSLHVNSHPTNKTVIMFEGEGDANAYFRPINGETLCEVCERPFKEHPRDRQWLDNEGGFYLRRICTGDLISLETNGNKEAKAKKR